jgi:GGDEF domain-containing protein
MGMTMCTVIKNVGERLKKYLREKKTLKSIGYYEFMIKFAQAY